MPQPFNPLEFLNLAQEITSQHTGEAKLRTAVNRAYYAAFLIARDKTYPRKTNVKHGQVIKSVKQRNRAVGDKLSALYRLREVADYHLIPKDPTRSDWEQNWTVVQNIVHDILPKLQIL